VLLRQREHTEDCSLSIKSVKQMEKRNYSGAGGETGGVGGGRWWGFGFELGKRRVWTPDSILVVDLSRCKRKTFLMSLYSD
jgi:hypothetical protein